MDDLRCTEGLAGLPVTDGHLAIRFDEGDGINQRAARIPVVRGLYLHPHEDRRRGYRFGLGLGLIRSNRGVTLVRPWLTLRGRLRLRRRIVVINTARHPS